MCLVALLKMFLINIMIIRIFIFLFIFFTLLKVVAVSYTNFDLFGDEAQYWAWSKNIDYGYLSKPPLLSWMIGFYALVLGDSFVSLKLFPIFFYFFSCLVVYKFSRKISFSKETSLICSLSFLIMPAVSVSSFLISTDILLLLFWTASMIVLIDLRDDPSLKNFTLLGITLGLAFLSKYAAVYFFLSLLLLVLFEKNYKKLFYNNKIKFVYFFCVVLLVMLPNILWNMEHGWVTLAHTSSNANLDNINLNFFRGLGFLGIQIIMIGPILFFGMLYNLKKISFDKENVFLLCFSIPIILIVFLESVLVRANANWAAVALVALLLFFIRSLKSSKQIFLVSNFVINLMFGCILFILIAISHNSKVFQRVSGINDFSIEIKSLLNENSSIVVSDRLLYSNLKYEYRNQNIEILMPHSPGTNITKHFQISFPLKKDFSKNFLFLGNPNDIKYIDAPYKIKLLKEHNPDFLSSPVRVYEVVF